ncbi:MAG: polysaccharide deacetylase family protein, partial [Candidatus Thorarchaeota archaeon]
LGISSNVIIHLIEKHLIERGFLGELSKSPLAVVTHDIDTDFCQKEGREIVSTVENREGVHATWFFVPQSVEYCLDKGGVQELTEEGHEIGMHGFAHDGKLALDNPAKLTRQLKKGKSVLESVGAKVASFRSPWTLRSSILLQTLASVGFVVDSSFPDVDTLGMTSGRPGLSYNRPFRPLIVKDESLVEPLTLWEVPMTSPQDVQMIEDLKLTGDNLLKVWIYKAKFCMDFGGVFVLHTHPVHIVNHLDEYARILKLLKATGFRLLRMEDLASELQPSLLEQTGLQSLNQKDQTTPKEFSS